MGEDGIYNVELVVIAIDDRNGVCATISNLLYLLYLYLLYFTYICDKLRLVSDAMPRIKALTIVGALASYLTKRARGPKVRLYSVVDSIIRVHTRVLRDAYQGME